MHTPKLKEELDKAVCFRQTFSISSDMILRKLVEVKGVHVGGKNINNFRYADDTVLIAESQAQLQELLDRVVNASQEKGLTINCKKTEW